MASYRQIFRDAYGPFPHPCYFCGELVDGHTRPFNDLATVIHHRDHNHENNDPTNLCAAHQSCHLAYHGAIKQASKRQPTKRVRKAFLAQFGPFPHPCHYCGVLLDGRTKPFNRTATVVIAEGNSCFPAHHGCRAASRMLGNTNLKGYRPTPAQRAKTSASNKGDPRMVQGGLAGRGKKRSPETRARMSAARQKLVAEGWTMAPDARKKIATAHLGTKASADTRAKMSAALKGNTRRLGTKMSPEAKARISESLKGRPVSAETRAKLRAAQLRHSKLC